MSYLHLSDGRTLFYQEEGRGRPVVFLHGWKASADVYAAPCRLLAEEFRCIRYDHCGHMRSSVPAQAPDLGTLAEDLHQLLTGLQLQDPALVGWSMGAMTILEYLRRFGCGGIDRIVLVDAAAHKLTDPRQLAAETALARADFHEFMRQYYLTRIPGFADLPARQQDADIRRKLQGHHPAVLTSLWAAFSRRDHRDVLPAITCPTAIFHAGILPACDDAAARYYADHIPAPVQVVCFRAQSHAIPTEAPERFAGALRAFLRS